MSDPVIDALRRGDAASAVAAARDAVVAHPEDAEAHHLLGLALQLSGDSDGAGRSIDEAIALAPDRPLYHMSRSTLALSAGDRAAAEAALGDAVALDPNHLQAYVAQSQLALARGDVAEAEQRLLRATRIDESHPQVLLAQGNLRLAQRDLDGAIRAFTEAVKRAPYDAVAHSCLGVAYLRRGMLDFALQALRNALSQRPQLDAARRALVEVLVRQRRHADAASEARLLVEHAPANATAWRLLGDLEAAVGNVAAAEHAYVAALGHAPADGRALAALVGTWVQAGQAARAREFLDQRLEQDPGSEFDWQLRLSVERGDREGSVAVAERWQSLRPDSAAANETAARIAEARGEQERAEALADAALRIDAGRIAAQLIKARAEIRRDPALALARLSPLADRNSDPRMRRPLLGWLGHAADAAGDVEAALRHWLAGHALSEIGGRLPPLGAIDDHLETSIERALDAPAVAADNGQPPPILLLGAPGGGAERLAALLRGQAEHPLLDDRFGAQGRNDRFLRPDYEGWMANDPAAIAELGGSWRAGLAERGFSGLSVIEWLQRWDARFLPAIAQSLPGTRFLVALRDPRDTLLNWIAFGAPQRWPVRDLDKAAEWLALALAHLFEIGKHRRFTQAVVALEDLEQTPEQVLPPLCSFLGLETPPDATHYLQSLTATAGWPTALPAGSWRRYQEVLAGPFAALRPVVEAFRYPQA